MSFLDKVTKAVGDAVDKGKKDLDQFVRIQKINGEIGTIESKVAELGREVLLVKQEAGATAIEMVKAGRFSSPELQAFVARLESIDQQIAAHQATLAERKADIERIKSEHAAEHAADRSGEAAPAPPVVPPPLPGAASTVPPVPPPVAQPVVPPPIVPPPIPQGARACPQCGQPAGAGAFCTQCGAKL